MSINFGGGQTQQRTQTQAVNVPAMSPQEQALSAANTQFAPQQIAYLQQAALRQQLLEQQQAAQYGGAGSQAAQNLQGYMNGNIINPQAMSAINQMFAPLVQQGQTDITRAAQEAADRRGLALSDTPIGQPYLDQLRRFQSDMMGQKAQAYLNQGNTQYNQALGTGQFTQGLQQQAQQNRLALGQAQPGSYGLQGQLNQFRLASAPQTSGLNIQGTQNPQFGFSGQNVAQALGGIGAAYNSLSGGWGNSGGLPAVGTNMGSGYGTGLFGGMMP